MNRIRTLLFALGAIALLGGCATDSPSTAPEARVQLGMSRDDLKFYFGAPVRIEPVAGGGEKWIYRFRAEPQSSTETTYDFSGKTTTSSVTWELGKEISEQPVHVSNAGFVIQPLPQAKMVKN